MLQSLIWNLSWNISVSWKVNWAKVGFWYCIKIFQISAGTWLIGDFSPENGGLMTSITGIYKKINNIGCVLVGCGFITAFLLSCSVSNI